MKIPPLQKQRPNFSKVNPDGRQNNTLLRNDIYASSPPRAAGRVSSTPPPPAAAHRGPARGLSRTATASRSQKSLPRFSKVTFDLAAAGWTPSSSPPSAIPFASQAFILEFASAFVSRCPTCQPYLDRAPLLAFVCPQQAPALPLDVISAPQNGEVKRGCVSVRPLNSGGTMETVLAR